MKVVQNDPQLRHLWTAGYASAAIWDWGRGRVIPLCADRLSVPNGVNPAARPDSAGGDVEQLGAGYVVVQWRDRGFQVDTARPHQVPASIAVMRSGGRPGMAYRSKVSYGTRIPTKPACHSTTTLLSERSR
jgi:hypothetical protein